MFLPFPLQTVEELEGRLRNYMEDILGIVRSLLTVLSPSSSPTAAAETELALAAQSPLEIGDEMPARAHHDMDLVHHRESTAPANKCMLIQARE